jgi:GMP synthase-like glutamine amidotransferase
MTVVIVQHEESVPPGLIAQVLDEEGIDYRIFEAWHDEDWPDVSDIGALIVMGGTMNVDETERFPFLERSRALMRSAVHSDIPILGVCLGSQMLARVSGSGVFRSDPRNAGFSGVTATPEGRGDPVIGPFADGTPVLQFHEDTFEAPDEATLLATSDTSGLVQAFRIGDSAYAVQFHFEVDRDILRGWVDDIGSERMRADWGVSSEELLAIADRHLPAQTEAGRRLVKGFLSLLHP